MLGVISCADGQVLQNPECGTKLQLGPKYHIAYLFETIINKEIYHKSGFKTFHLFYARAVRCCYSLGHLLNSNIQKLS